ncbi:lysM domain-containing GPI-anchored protein 1 [Cryptomeria japonica]|uniref:lysM domain-containing GPI-anchored protein 1 n=1 Tax=Cryptomeria japonica TaxID=3369 RepID=UPI0027D9D2D6|nr:lysM domain-containing GPI-anchored protein 1 [Cryptomeria japonica]
MGVSFHGPSRIPSCFFVLIMLCFFNGQLEVYCKSTIEPCDGSDTCNAMVGYNLHTDLKISEVASRFKVDPVAPLGVNGIDVSYPDVENQILPTKYFLRVPVTCNCVNGLRQCSSVTYKVRASDTLYNIANSVFGGLVTAEQVRVVNCISDPNLIDMGQSLTIPLPCSCFNGTDNGLPTIYLSYVVQPEDTLAGLGVKYGTTIIDLMTVNALGAAAIKAGDIIVVPLGALPALKELPASIGKLGLLEFLDISLCEDLKELPQEIGQLKQLKYFDMRECSRLRRLPKSVCELSSLKHVICDEKIRHLWLQVKASFVPDLRVEIVEPQFTLDWLDD